MSDLTATWTRNSFEVEAVQITEENIIDVAVWCGGKLYQSLEHFPKRYIAMRITSAARAHNVKAWAGDWITFAKGEFKHHKDKTFRQTFHQKTVSFEDVLAVLDDFIVGVDEAMNRDLYSVRNEAAMKIVKLFEGE